MGGLKPYVYAAVLAATFGTGWAVNGWRVGAQVSDLKAAHSRSLLVATEAGLSQLKIATDERDAAQARLVAIARDGLADIQKAKDETERLRSCIARGTCGLRIAATCPPNTPAVPEAPGGGVVATAAGPVLSPAAQSDYFALRSNIELTEGVLASCQKTLGALAGGLATTPHAPAP